MAPIGLDPLVNANATLQRSKELLAESAKVAEILFEKSQAYNSAIILAGFGGLFALLTASAAILPPQVLAASAILLGISLITYVGYIIFNMYTMSFVMLRSAEKQLLNAKSVQQNAGLDTSDIIKALGRLKWNIKLWKTVWIVAVATGLSAGILMLIFYIGSLIAPK